MTEAEDRVSPAMLRWTGRSEPLRFHVNDPDLEIRRLWLGCYPELPDLARSRWSGSQRDAQEAIIGEALMEIGAAA